MKKDIIFYSQPCLVDGKVIAINLLNAVLLPQVS